MEEFKEGAKAIAEIAKLGTKALDTTSQFGVFLSKMFGTPAEDAYAIVGDKIRFIQWERQVRMVEAINEYHKERGYPPVRTIPPKFAIPMITNAGLEEDDDLQDIWCRLIANSMDKNFDVEIRYAFIEIIKSLTYLDAKVLKYVYDEVSKKSDSTIMHMSKISLDAETINKYVDVSEDELDISFNNLMRVQCLRNPSLENSIFVPEQGQIVFTKNGKTHVALTSLGIAFTKICMG